jgi:hypothetical protein
MANQITNLDVAVAVGLVVSIVTLGLQLFAPQAFLALDPRTWSHGGWLAINVAVIVALAGIRIRQG